MSSSGTSNNRGQFAMTVMTCSGKTCDVHYTSARRESPPKGAGFFSIWYQRILTYPGKGSVFRLSAANVGCEEEFDKFMGFSKSLHELVESEVLHPDVSCRLCWAQAGVDVLGKSKKYRCHVLVAVQR